MAHCLAGVGHALVSGGHAVGGGGQAAVHVLGEPEFDVAALVGGGMYAQRVNTVEQAFHRRMAQIEFKIARQELHREDIRDLIELTTKRMEILHLVGTLLLAFAMGWYTDSETWQLPVWFTDLFIISNFSALGYLIMCVWMAMYASIAARSIGTRLLTSYARLSLPTKSDLDVIRNPVFGKPNQDIGRTTGAAGVLAETAQEEASEDHQQHFREFLEQLPRWFAYDMWARICISLGVYQLLQAMAYFSLAIMWSKYPLGAIMSFIAVNCLGVVVLWLDIGQNLDDFNDVSALFFLKVMPCVLAITLILAQSLFPHIMRGERYLEGILVLLTFCAHAGWLWYLQDIFRPKEDQDGKDTSKFKPTKFSNVLQWIPQGHTMSRWQPEAFTPTIRASSTKVIRSKPEVKEKVAKLDENSEGSQEAKDSTKHLSKEDGRLEVNGGHTVGKWMQPLHYKKKHAVDDLPVRMLTLFSTITICWWIIAGCIHSAILLFDKFNHLKGFTGSNDMTPLRVENVAWPQPTSLFTVDGLYCSDSDVMITNGFSMYSIVKEAAKSAEALNFIKDGKVAATICGAQRCNTISPPDSAGSWLMAQLDPLSHSETKLPVPSSWRRLAGTWVTCSADADSDCSSGWLAGWDGKNVVAATLTNTESTMNPWRVEPRFKVDPAIGLCAGALDECNDRKAVQKYSDVRAMHMSAGGEVLLVLLGNGVLDFWDLSKGAVVKRSYLDSSYTSMCQSGEHVYLSREEDTSPNLMTMDVPPSIFSLVQHPQPLHVDFHEHKEGGHIVPTASSEQAPAKGLLYDPHEESETSHEHDEHEFGHQPHQHRGLPWSEHNQGRRFKFGRPGLLVQKDTSHEQAAVSATNHEQAEHAQSVHDKAEAPATRKKEKNGEASSSTLK
jgi:hypothetical protein